MTQKLAVIRKLFDDDDWEEKIGGKIFAVHFDKPRKFYIGRLNKVFAEDADMPVNRVSFRYKISHNDAVNKRFKFSRFMDFRGLGKYFTKPSVPLEDVPAGDVFYGPIIYEAGANNTIKIDDETCCDVSRMWKVFCDAYGR